MGKDLNLIYQYRLKYSLKFSQPFISTLKKYPIQHHDDWGKSYFQNLKGAIKKAGYLPQNRRCGYCRKRLNIDARYDHLDHIIPKSQCKGWMFKRKNLVICCVTCNSNKQDANTLSVNHKKRGFPKYSSGFTIFNPHYDKWEDCFKIEDGMFITAKNKKGEETIRICKLHSYGYSVQFADESGLNTKGAIKRSVHRVSRFPVDSIEFKAANKVIEYYESLI
jgi:uncharacterized protein (TIGR02646 family)